MTYTFLNTKQIIIVLFSLFATFALSGQNIAFQENFESATLNMASTNTGSGQWAVNSRLHSQGLKCDSATVAQSNTTYLTSSSFSTVGKHDVYLNFDHICKVEFNDSAVIEVSNDNGTTWNRLTASQYMVNNNRFGSLSNRFCAGSYTQWDIANNSTVPQNSWWKTEKFNISSFAANSANVKIRFALIDGNANGSNNSAGWFIDSVFVEAIVSELFPPVITLISPTSNYTTNSSNATTIKAIITDASGIDTAYIAYTVSGGFVDTIGMTILNGDTFHASVPFKGYGRTIYYKIIAKDASFAKNTTVSPNSGNYTITSEYDSFVALWTESFENGIPNNWINNTGSTNWTIRSGMTPSGFTGPKKAYSGTKYLYTEATYNFNKTAKLISPVYDISNTNSPKVSFYYHMFGSHMGTLHFDVYYNGAWINDVFVKSGQQNTSYTDPWKEAFIDVSAYKSANFKMRFRGNIGPSYKSDMAIDKIVVGQIAQLTNDIGVAEITNPNASVFTNSPFDVKVKVQNYGSDTVNSAIINWALDGVNQTAFNYTNALYNNTTSSDITIGNTSVLAGNHKIVAWTSNPNGSIDNNIINDTASYSFYGCNSFLSGTYTIGGAGADYADLNSAANVLNNCGINGPVVFNITSGTYNEQFELSTVSGVSATNTITFQSATGDSTSVILKHSASSANDNFVVKLNTPYVKFKAITIEAEGNSFAKAINLADSIHDFSIENSVLKTTQINSTNSSNRALIVGWKVGNNILIKNNHFINGSFAVTLVGYSSTNWMITNNNIKNPKFIGVYIKLSESSNVSNNTIISNSTEDNFRGIHFFDCSGTAIIKKNKIITSNTKYAKGVLLALSQFNVANPTIIANNIMQIHCNSTSSTYSAGIHCFKSNNISVYYNSVRIRGSQAKSSAVIMKPLITNNSGMNVINNILTNHAGGYAIYIDNVKTPVIHNHNDYFTTSSKFAYTNGNNVNSLASWLSTTSATNEYNVDPYFISLNNLHTTNGFLDSKGTPIAGITTDFDGETRNATTPDIGADEFSKAPNDIFLSEILAPIGSCGLGNETIIARLINSGTDTIKNTFTASYQLLGGAVVTENVNTNINPGDTLDYSFTTIANLSAFSLGHDTTFNISVWVKIANDALLFNDSVNINVFSGYQMPAPITVNDTINYGSTATVKAYGNNLYFWETQNSANYLVSDTFYNTPVLYDTTTYWVTSRSFTDPVPTIIGNNSLEQERVPFYGSQNYSWSKMLYLSSELGSGGRIDSIAFKVRNFSGSITLNNQKIFYKEWVNPYIQSTAYINSSTLTKVFDGTVVINGNGWFTIVFDSPIIYDGVSNLLFQWENHSGLSHSICPKFEASYASYSTQFKYTSSSFNALKSGHGSGNSFRPNLKIFTSGLGCYGQQAPVTVIVNNIPANDIQLTSITNPVSGYDLDTNEAVIINVKNLGNTPVDTIPLELHLNSTIIYDTIFQHLNSGATTQFTFNKALDLSAYATDTLVVIANSTNDTYHVNDTIKKLIINSPLNYCSIPVSHGDMINITNVKIANLNHSTLPVGNKYNDFTNTVAPLMLSPGETYSLSVTTDYTGGIPNTNSLWINVFIDFNHDGVFNTTNELVLFKSSHTSQTETVNVTVPTNAIINKPVRMRVVMRDNGNKINTGPCNYIYRGEVEDYLVEFLPVIQEDAGVIAINPNQFAANTLTNMNVDIKNYGLDSLRKVKINWKVDGQMQAVTNWTGKLYKDSIKTNIAIGSYTFAAGQHNITAWTELPNDSNDIYNYNDTLKTDFYVCNGALSGSYTIGGTNADYQTINDAIFALNMCGISGNVVMNIADGVYNTQFEIGAIQGCSSTASITFQSLSGDSSAVVINYNALQSYNNFIVKMNNAKYINIRKLSFIAQGQNFGTAIVFINNNSNINISNCKIATTQGYSSNKYLINQSMDADSFITINNNIIENGTYAIYLEGESLANCDYKTVISNNIITGFCEIGIHAKNQKSLKIIHNTIDKTSGYARPDIWGVYANGLDSDFKITHNTININVNSSKVRGLYFNKNTCTSNLRGLIANNMISCSVGVLKENMGIYLYKSINFDVFYNSVNIYGSSSTSTSLFVEFGSHNRIVNNIFANKALGKCINVANPPAIDTIHHNDYYTTGTYIAFWFSDKASLADLKAVNNMDSFSQDINPIFISNTDLHASNVLLDDTASVIASITTDIDGELRSLTKPCIGADEFQVTNIDMGVVNLAYPIQSNCIGSSEAVAVTVRNFGQDTIFFATDTTNVFVKSVGINPTTFPTVSINSGFLPNGMDTVVVVSTNYNMSTAGNYTFEAYTSVSSDGIAQNDTMPVSTMDVNPIITNFPYVENFDNFTVGSLSNGWTKSNTNFTWTSNSGATPTNATGPATDHSGNGNYLYTESNNTSGKTTLTSPCFDFTSLNHGILSFWYYFYGNNIDTMYIQGKDVNGIYITIDTIVGAQQFSSYENWKSRDVLLTSLHNGINNIRFVVIGSGNLSDAAIDDINIYDAPQYDIEVSAIVKPMNLFKPTGDAVDTVSIKIFNNGYDTILPSTNASVNYSYNGQTPVTMAITDTILPLEFKVIKISTPFTVVSGAKSFKVYSTLSSDNNAMNDSIITTFFGIETKLLSYSNDFESSNDFFTTSNYCWQKGLPNGNVINTAHSGINAWMTRLTGGYLNDNVSYLYTPIYDFSNVVASDSAVLSFYQSMNVVNDDNGVIEYSLNNGATWIKLGYIGLSSSVATNWYNNSTNGYHNWSSNNSSWQLSKIKIPFHGATKAQFRFVFTASQNTNNTDGWAIDDFKITLPKISNDVGFVQITTPSTNTTLGSSITVSGKIKNFGYSNQNNFLVNYNVNGATVVDTFNIAGVGIMPDSIKSFTFTKPYIVGANSTSVCLSTALTGDVYTYNDTACTALTIAQANKDVGVVSISVSPNWNDTTKYSFNTEVTVKIVNFGLNTITSIPVEYKIGLTTKSGTWTGSVASNDTVSYTFTQKYTHKLGQYSICAKTKYANDANSTNDSICTSFIGINDTKVNISDKDEFLVMQNRPNPAKGITYIDFNIPTDAHIVFELRNSLGQIIKRKESSYSTGKHTIKVNIDNLSNGIYFYIIRYKDTFKIKRMIVNKV